MPLLSICIPTYEMKGYGREFLQQSFDRIMAQTFRDFDVIVSDHSEDDSIEKLCKEYTSRFTIRYHRNSSNRGSSSANINNAIRHATGSIIKILFQDDFLYGNDALQKTVDHFDKEQDRWLVSACIHTIDGIHFFRPFYPHYTKDVHLGNNRIGSPSVLTIKNTHPFLFDEQLLWLMDGEYYKRLHAAYGMPKILNNTTVANRIGKHQVTASLATRERRKREFNYVLKKYEHGIAKLYYHSMYGLRRTIKTLLS